MHTVDDDLSKRQAVLETVFGFSQSDLVANQSGELSAAQKKRVSSKHYANSRFAWVAFTVIFGVGFLGFCADMLRTGTFGIHSLSVYVGVTVFFGLILWGFILYYRNQMKRTLWDGKIFPVKGRIQLFTMRHEKLLHRYFGVDDHRFQIERYDYFELLRQSGLAGQEAIMYVSTPRKAIQSVELKT
ncbi:hypothetical protein [Rhodopirellula sallentina]|uniref:Putative membrane protein n=1 Tax=Rhodopirellula sallentina SM41 TaxID=1263870 RepID=M5U3X6_9BACT|nr:hypothetical protein [Rhodopirellula sallentina]EMI56155.1 putative membrane protein [Rhodopirellula sallentina SM41]